MDRFTIRKSTCSSKNSNLCELDQSQDLQTTASLESTEPVVDGPTKKRKRTWVRQYSKSYLNYGFTDCSQGNENPKPQCVICYEVLSSESLKPSKLLRHLTTKHPELQKKPLEFFERKEKELKMGVKLMQRNLPDHENALKASFLVAYRVAKAKAAHTVAEKLILPCAIDMVSEMIGKESVTKIKAIPLSDNSISRRIEDIATNLRNVLLRKLTSVKEFAIQLDESTDISHQAMLLVYVRYPYENNFVEDLLCCLTLPTHTTGEEIFKALDQTLIKDYKLEWKNLKGITSDGAASMTGKHSGAVKRMQDAAGGNIPWTHCFIHREALAAKVLSTELNNVLQNVVKIVNFIKASSLNNRIFEALCNEMGSSHKHLLLHTEIRWLSRGKVLSRMYELRSEIQRFCADKKNFIFRAI